MRKLILSTLLFAWSMTVYAAQSDNIHKESTDIVGTNIAPPVSKTSNNNLSLANTSQALVSKTTNNIPLADFKNSMVYVRCIFYIDNKVQLMWGKIDKSQNSLAQEAVYPYAVIKGTWYNSSSTRESTLNNVFYTKASVDDVLNTCKFAFKEKKYAIEKFNTQFINYFAALSQYSFDYDFWFNDGLKGVENRPSKTALINQLVVFGDSLSDTHHMFNKSLWVIPDPKRYLYGRFTNGLVWSEYVAQYLGVNLLTLAEGGSEVVPEGSQGFATKSLKEQYDNYVNFYKNIPQGYDKAIEKSLFVVFTGGNDFLNQTSGGKAKDIAAGYLKIIRNLVNDGAKYIMIPIYFDVSITPEARATEKNKAGFIAKLRKDVEEFNQEVLNGVNQLKSSNKDVNFLMPDIESSVKIIKAQYFQSGNTSDACSAGSYWRNPLNDQMKYICKDKMKYLFWDKVHPTAKAHCYLGYHTNLYLSSQLGLEQPTQNIDSCEVNYI